MTRKDSKQLVELLLATYDQNKFSSSATRLAYERGILTGLLASLVHNDTYAAAVVKQLIKNRRQQ